MDLAAVHIELVDEIKLRLGYVGNVSAPKLALELEELAGQFQELGICHLLELADPDMFTRNLVWSGHSRRFFLHRSQIEGNVNDRRLALSRTMSFFCALAAGALNLARDIAGLSLAAWNKDWEYEDDYLYFYYWHQVVLNQAWLSGDQAAGVLERFRESLEEQPSARFDVTVSLSARDRDGFVSAFTAFIEEEQEKLDRERTSASVVEGEVGYWPRSYVSVEGLGLLKLAELLRLQVPEEFTLCPALARLPFKDETEIDLFVELEKHPD